MDILSTHYLLYALAHFSTQSLLLLLISGVDSKQTKNYRSGFLFSPSHIFEYLRTRFRAIILHMNHALKPKTTKEIPSELTDALKLISLHIFLSSGIIIRKILMVVNMYELIIIIFILFSRLIPDDLIFFLESQL